MTSPEQPDVPAESGQQVGDLLARFARSGPDADSGADRRRLLGALATALGASARGAGTVAVLGGRWLADLLLEAAPRIPVRDLGTLVRHHEGRTGEDLADALVAAAEKATTAVGAAGGALAAVQFAAPPTLLATPVQIAAETLAVAAVEVKLIAELHEVYGVPVHGSGTQRGVAYVTAWAGRRGVDPFGPKGFSAALGSAAKRQLRRRLVGRAGRNLTTMGPLLTGAVAGGVINRRETHKLGEEVRADLRRRTSRR